MDDSKRTTSRVRLGDVPVDSGLLVIVDPGYIHGKESLDELAAVLDVLAETSYGGPILSYYRNPNLRVGVGVKLVSDGRYPIWGVVDETGNELSQIIIDLHPPEDDEPDENAVADTSLDPFSKADDDVAGG